MVLKVHTYTLVLPTVAALPVDGRGLGIHPTAPPPSLPAFPNVLWHWSGPVAPPWARVLERSATFAAAGAGTIRPLPLRAVAGGEATPVPGAASVAGESGRDATADERMCAVFERLTELREACRDGEARLPGELARRYLLGIDVEVKYQSYAHRWSNLLERCTESERAGLEAGLAEVSAVPHPTIVAAVQTLIDALPTFGIEAEETVRVTSGLRSIAIHIADHVPLPGGHGEDLEVIAATTEALRRAVQPDGGAADLRYVRLFMKVLATRIERLAHRYHRPVHFPRVAAQGFAFRLGKSDLSLVLTDALNILQTPRADWKGADRVRTLLEAMALRLHQGRHTTSGLRTLLEDRDFVRLTRRLGVIDTLAFVLRAEYRRIGGEPRAPRDIFQAAMLAAYDRAAARSQRTVRPPAAQRPPDPLTRAVHLLSREFDLAMHAICHTGVSVAHALRQLLARDRPDAAVTWVRTLLSRTREEISGRCPVALDEEHTACLGQFLAHVAARVDHAALWRGRPLNAIPQDPLVTELLPPLVDGMIADHISGVMRAASADPAVRRWMAHILGERYRGIAVFDATAQRATIEWTSVFARAWAGATINDDLQLIQLLLGERYTAITTAEVTPPGFQHQVARVVAGRVRVRYIVARAGPPYYRRQHGVGAVAEYFQSHLAQWRLREPTAVMRIVSGGGYARIHLQGGQWGGRGAKEVVAYLLAQPWVHEADLSALPGAVEQAIQAVLRLRIDARQQLFQTSGQSTGATNVAKAAATAAALAPASDTQLLAPYLSAIRAACSGLPSVGGGPIGRQRETERLQIFCAQVLKQLRAGTLPPKPTVNTPMVLKALAQDVHRYVMGEEE